MFPLTKNILPLRDQGLQSCRAPVEEVGNTKSPSVSLGMMVNAASCLCPFVIRLMHSSCLEHSTIRVFDVMHTLYHQGRHSNFQNIASQLMHNLLLKGHFIFCRFTNLTAAISWRNNYINCWILPPKSGCKALHQGLEANPDSRNLGVKLSSFVTVAKAHEHYNKLLTGN